MILSHWRMTENSTEFDTKHTWVFEHFDTMSPVILTGKKLLLETQDEKALRQLSTGWRTKYSGAGSREHSCFLLLDASTASRTPALREDSSWNLNCFKRLLQLWSHTTPVYWKLTHCFSSKHGEGMEGPSVCRQLTVNWPSAEGLWWPPFPTCKTANPRTADPCLLLRGSKKCW